ncbi:3-methyl-2-oxobutanoate hydroxymethyltransferase [Paenibacillus glycanilyticus]|uniref:3-methyl-2-oxobutanoate hydroxymethyltransferase n=1 Tax=Paenibacillus glycanilyticus TaxID=126569 RepID=UPI002041D699|nr:3-methyl-2-oxobutanoate hydroxymethyltransferase [Paenibacillus glycanilyticus]MCM3627491.1 3-methyl-2-oxobutanoate hydroxymethyltransferase [Paenibacillus glycanilyticus]
MRKRLTITNLKKMKQDKNPISMLTAYDYPSAVLAEEAGLDVILVGDSLGNVVLGYDTTIPVTLEDMIYHTRAVARGAKNTFIVTDMPFMTYGIGRESTLRNAARLMQEGGAQALKLEGGEEIAAEVAALVKAGIPVMGHIGLTPQSVHQLGGYKVQGKLEKEAEKLMEDAKALEAAGAFAIVLELVTEPIATAISKELSIPTIGIGAGRGCDGQVLVYHDILQYSSPYIEKKMVKTYADIGSTIRNAISSYVSEVKAGAFPAEEHAFGAKPEAINHLYGAGEAANHNNGKQASREESPKRDFVSNHS